MEEVVQTAIRSGLAVLCFTDHIDWDYPVPDLIFDFNIDDYFTRTRELKEQYKDRIKILTGVELGMQPHLGDRYRALLSGHPFDYAIGSQHLVDNMDPYYPETFAGRDTATVYRHYFEETYENVKAFHDFDSMGHLDYIVRYGPKRKNIYSYRRYADIIDEILKLLVRYNIAIEINTCGLRKSVGTTNPHPDVLKRYRELGGTLVTMGSDAHQSMFLGYEFDRARAILRDCGFTHFVYFERREPRFVKL